METFIGKVVTDRPEVLDAAMELVSRHKDDPEEFSYVKAILRVYGITLCELSNGVIVVYWCSNEEADKILSAPIEQLPEFLTDDDYGLRLLAIHRLEELNE